MNILTLIEAKRDGQPLSNEEIRRFVASIVTDEVPDYQLASFLMATFFRGLNTEETTALTLAMRDSGDVLRFPKDKRPLVDKHSTGGVGDKVSLPLAPLLACLGFRVPMISGRGLGITGGTLDKLDSIPGFQTQLPTERIVEIVQKVGCVICGQTDRMVPADKKLYALRDVTGTVPSIPLIVSSVLSKKLAESLDALILDVKFGSAAFMQTKAEARKLAKAMVALGNKCGVNTRAILTDMNTPIGRAAGNWLEVKESVAALAPLPSCGHPPHEPQDRNIDYQQLAHLEVAWVQSANLGSGNSLPIGWGEGRGEGRADDLRELVLACAAHLLVQTGKAESFKAARQHAEGCLNSRAPRRKWDAMLAAQGADLAAFRRKLALDHTAPTVLELKAARNGFVSRCDARLIGEAIRALGGGRLTKECSINYDVGVDHLLKPGERVRSGDVLARIHASDRTAAQAARRRLKGAFAISGRPIPSSPLLLEVISR